MNASGAWRSIVFGSFLSLAALVYGQSPSERATGQSASPFIIRIDQSLLEPLRSQEIDHRAEVDQIVLGTRAVGESHTIGKIDVEMVSDHEDVKFNVKFHGRTQTRTTGYNGPALIYSRTRTDFVCTRQVTLDPDQGFVASPCKLQAETTLVYEGFGSSRQGLGSRLIARVAQRRANELHAAALQIAARDNREEVRRAFDDRLDRQLVSLNRELALVRYVNAALSQNSKPRLLARSGSNCIFIGLGRGNSLRPAMAPPQRDDAAPIEIWIHPAVLGDRARTMVRLMERLESRIVPDPSPLAVSHLSIGSEKDSTGPLGVEVYEGWIVVSLRGEEPILASIRKVREEAQPPAVSRVPLSQR